MLGRRGEPPSERQPEEGAMAEETRTDVTGEVYRHPGGNPAPADRHSGEVLRASKASAYWKDNLKLLGGLLAIWALVSYGAGIWFADALNTVEIGGFKLGFWFAQQGSIYVFVALIFVYAWAMHRIERRHGVDDDDA
jgi:putative solute:sodium symporter small subunit